jgi:hypothetical protein
MMEPWSVAWFTRLHVLAFVALLAISVAAMMLFGIIRTKGLLRDKLSGRLSPARIQALVVTFTGAGVYFGKVFRDPAAEALPAADVELLVALGGSQAIYLLGKAGSALNVWSRLIGTHR